MADVMSPSSFEAVRRRILDDSDNRELVARGYRPLYTAGAGARIAIIGQAPGLRAQESGIAWNDASGAQLIDWLGITEQRFRDPEQVTLLPMDFFYPGKGRSGDLPPRRGFAARWHPKLLELMPRIRLTLLVGSYAQAHYLGARRKANLTETVRAYEQYLPEYLPLVHPSPLNFRWHLRNPWFAAEVVPVLRDRVADALDPSP
jgi:uracil-DNA glycosylase